MSVTEFAVAEVLSVWVFRLAEGVWLDEGFAPEPPPHAVINMVNTKTHVSEAKAFLLFNRNSELWTVTKKFSQLMMLKLIQKFHDVCS